jgi:hypothetical protein
MRVLSKTEVMEAVKNSINFTEVLRKLSIKKTGHSFVQIKNMIISFGLNTEHFLGIRSNSGKIHVGGPIKNKEDVLIRGKSRGRTSQLRRALLENDIEYKCFDCSQGGIWFGKPLVLQIDHIDGDNTNNEKTNLCWRCPNCHSQTDNFCVPLGHKRVIHTYNKHTSGIMFALVMAKQNREISEDEYNKLIQNYQKLVPNRKKTGIGETASNDEIKEIRAKFKAGANKCQLAREYQKDRSSIYNIVTMKTYKDVI